MRVLDLVRCPELGCADVRHSLYRVPEVALDPDLIQIVMVSEAAPARPEDWFFGGGDALFARTTVETFRDAGEDVSAIEDVLALGVYLTTAVKCGKTGYTIATPTIQACSRLLESELQLFPLARVLMLMGDAAIKAVNAIAKRSGEPRVVPAGATYKLRGGDYSFRGLKVFPSYVQAGPAFFVEKSKRRMIAEDISAALAYVRG